MWVVCTGCYHVPTCCPSNIPVPRELDKTNLPPYRIEPPDILILDVLRTVPLPPYHIQPLDALIIRATNTLPDEPIDSTFIVEPEGTVYLGPSYGSVKIVDMTKYQAQAEIKKELDKILKDPQVNISIAQTRAQQQIRGEHLVYPDGTVNLGLYGSVLVAGMTIPEAKLAVEEHLSSYLEKPDVSVAIGGFNSKVYYVVTSGASNGETVLRLPCTGNETVLDAIAQAYGIAPQGSTKRIWIARPAPADSRCSQVLPVEWDAIVRGGDTTTNYQILPGDRVYIQAQFLVTLNNVVSKIAAPLERIFGVTLLGSEAIQQVAHPRSSGSGTGGGF
jgi:polysaccharide export outer membrane protein